MASKTTIRDLVGYMIGVLIVLAFVGTAYLVILRPSPGESDELGLILLGSLATMATSIVNYFFGSSAGSKVKTEMMADRPRDERSNDHVSS